MSEKPKRNECQLISQIMPSFETHFCDISCFRQIWENIALMSQKLKLNESLEVIPENL